MNLITKELIYPVDGGKTPSSHASTLIIQKDGSIRAAWFGGAHEKNPDVEIYTAVRKDGKWLEAEMVSVKSDTACWNPVLYADPSDADHILLFFKRGAEITGWQTFVRESFDSGMTWSEEREAVPGDTSDGRGPVKNKMLLLSDGTLLAGASHEAEDKTWWKVFFDLSFDGGKTWERTDYVIPESIEGKDEVKLIQPTMWEENGKVHALLRSDAGFVYRCDSDDMGRTWSRAYPTSLPNNNSGIDLVKLPDGRLALICNPVSDNWGARTPISLFLSADNGATWQKELDLEASEGEYSYPAILYREGKLHITFTYQRKSVMYCEVEI